MIKINDMKDLTRYSRELPEDVVLDRYAEWIINRR